MNTLINASVAVVCVSLLIVLYSSSKLRSTLKRPQGYILENQVTHARLQPEESSHAFTYPTVSLLLSVSALESHSLDLLRGWAFGYGGLWGRLVGLRSDAYLAPHNGKMSIRAKLETLLGEGSELEDAWMMTMPSFLGFEGINPLTVYFCYRRGDLWLTVLEIHNTFGESHVHILQIGVKEDPRPPKGYDHQWTFPREFHVSPFNDRSGFYTVSIKSPTHPPMSSPFQNTTSPRPTVRVHLHSPTPSAPAIPGLLKLTALLRPTSSRPLTTLSLLHVICRAPAVLLLSFPRILYEAWVLHYNKRLDVHIRPEPLQSGTGVCIRWQHPTALEEIAQRSVERFLQRRTLQMGITVSLVAADPAVSARVFAAESPSAHLTISYLSPRFFTLLLLCPSPRHALILGSNSERLFSVSSEDLFVSTFSFSTTLADDATPNRMQRLRCRPIPAGIRGALAVPRMHFLDEGGALGTAAIVGVLLMLEWLEETVFMWMRARMVSGEEPWRRWERAEEVYLKQR